MRMWNVKPSIMCRRHLLGEHLETHMFLGHLRAKRSVRGFIQHDLLEPLHLKVRHDQLALEINRRGYEHKSPLEIEASLLCYLSPDEKQHRLNVKNSEKELLRRCPDCRELSGRSNG